MSPMLDRCWEIYDELYKDLLEEEGSLWCSSTIRTGVDDLRRAINDLERDTVVCAPFRLTDSILLTAKWCSTPPDRQARLLIIYP